MYVLQQILERNKTESYLPRLDLIDWYRLRESMLIPFPNLWPKQFCSCLNQYIPDEPNKNICVFCTGQPGALPLLNQEAVKKAIKFGVALGANIPDKRKCTHHQQCKTLHPAWVTGQGYLCTGRMLCMPLTNDTAFPQRNRTLRRIF